MSLEDTCVCISCSRQIVIDNWPSCRSFPSLDMTARHAFQKSKACSATLRVSECGGTNPISERARDSLFVPRNIPRPARAGEEGSERDCGVGRRITSVTQKPRPEVLISQGTQDRPHPTVRPSKRTHLLRTCRGHLGEGLAHLGAILRRHTAEVEESYNDERVFRPRKGVGRFQPVKRCPWAR